MKKAKKTKTTALDRATARLRMALRRETKNIIEIGKILIEIRDKHLEHGEWQPWITENFDLSLRTAQNYCAAAEYVERAVKAKSATVADFSNLSPIVLYRLAAGSFDEQQGAAILAEAKAGKRVDEDAAWAICEKLAPADDDTDTDDDGSDDETTDTEDAEIEAILAAGADPAVPPPAPIPPSPDFALREFDHVISRLKGLMTKSFADFAGTIHSANDLENIADFIHAVTKARRQKAA
jgi:Protein of unknown function (DUF3102)